MHLLVLRNSSHTVNVLVSLLKSAGLLSNLEHAAERGADHEDRGSGPAARTQPGQIKDACSTSPRVKVEAGHAPQGAALDDVCRGAF